MYAEATKQSPRPPKVINGEIFVRLSILFYRFTITLIKIPAKLVCRIRQADSKIYVERQRN